METDQFCSKCGARVIKEKRCPDCGGLLRDNVRFCPGCGRAVGGKRSAPAVSDETLDIPIEAIERNILSETAAEIKAERRTQSAPRKAVSSEREPVRRGTSGTASVRAASSRNGSSGRTAERREISDSPSGRSSAGGTAVRKKQASVPAPPPRRKKPVYREEVWEEEDWDEEADEEDEDWEEDDWDDEEEGVDPITIMTIVAGCILLIVVAVLGFHLYRQYVPRNYGDTTEQEEEGEERQTGQEEQDPPEQGGEEDGGQGQTAGISGGISRLTIESNVNVRDQPSTSGTNVLKVAKAGETYACNGVTEDGDWYEIVLEDGTVGYVFQDYVSVE